MTTQDIRWLQRLENFQTAFEKLKAAMDILSVRILSDLESQGLIQIFKFTHELAWNVKRSYQPFTS